jgi:hypothetical protein
VRVFDFALAHPDLMRLIAWFSLEKKSEPPAERVAARDMKVAALFKAQTAGQLGTALPADFLLTAIMALATVWTATNPFGPSLDSNTQGRPADLRQNIAAAVRLLSGSKTDGG